MLNGTPELITYARLISSESTMLKQDIGELSKKKYLTLLGFPQANKSAGNNAFDEDDADDI